MRAFFSSIIIGAVSLFTASTASATAFFVDSAVSDPVVHDSSDDHAVWLPFFESISGTPLFGNSDGSDFNFVPSGLFVINPDNSVTLTGRIISQVDSDYGFDISVTFAGLMGPGTGGPKKELKNCAYGGSCGSIDPDTWDYFRLTEGEFIGFGEFDGLDFSVRERPRDNKFPLQLGEGANNKNTNFGASAWFFLSLLDGCDNSLCDDVEQLRKLKGDFNIDLVETPLPASLFLFGAGLAGWFTAARRKRKA